MCEEYTAAPNNNLFLFLMALHRNTVWICWISACEINPLYVYLFFFFIHLHNLSDRTEYKEQKAAVLFIIVWKYRVSVGSVKHKLYVIDADYDINVTEG